MRRRVGGQSRTGLAELIDESIGVENPLRRATGRRERRQSTRVEFRPVEPCLRLPFATEALREVELNGAVVCAAIEVRQVEVGSALREVSFENGYPVVVCGAEYAVFS